jgi:hypothetical protein
MRELGKQWKGERSGEKEAKKKGSVSHDGRSVTGKCAEGNSRLIFS